MNPIKKLYQKLLGSSDKGEEVEEPQDKGEEIEDPEVKEDFLLEGDPDSSCYLLFEVDQEGIVKMSSYWDGSEVSIFAFTELLYNLSTGQMAENIFEFLERECSENNYSTFLKIVAVYSQLLKGGLEDLVDSEKKQSQSPVVKPSELSNNDINPFDMR